MSSVWFTQAEMLLVICQLNDVVVLKTYGAAAHKLSFLTVLRYFWYV